MTTPTPPPPPPPPRPPAAGGPTPPPLRAAAPAAAAGAATPAFAAIGAVVIVGVAVLGGLALFGGNDSAATDEALVPTTIIALASTVPEPTVVPETTLAPTTLAPTTLALETTIPPTTAAPETTVAPVTTVTPTTAPPTTAPPETVPTTVAPPVSVPDSTPSDPNVEESKAIVRGGQIFLTGAVPTMEAGLRIEALASEILGPQNVFNNYVVDPAAGDPNLGNITVEDTITFATGSAVLQQSSETLLNQGLALLSIRPTMTITIVGHTDSRGSEESNLALSQARASSVKQWFVDQGVDGNRLSALGRGASEPIADNATSDGQRQNRRIQFFLENILGE